MKLNKLFTEYTVFAAGKPIRIFGEGAGTVTAEFCGDTASCVSDGGKWILELPAKKAGGPYVLKINLDGEEIVFSHVSVGRVYLFSGQSNAQLQLGFTEGAGKGETDGDLRFFCVDRPEDAYQRFGADAGWVPCAAEQADEHSALGYFLGKKVRRETGEPVGIICCYQGASIIESWLPAGEADKFGVKDMIRHIDHTYEGYVKWNYDGMLYETMLSSVTPFSLTGISWYQGESDTTEDEAGVYAGLCSRLFQVFRRDFGDEELPIEVVQITDFDPRSDEGWYAIQRAQAELPGIVKNCVTVESRDVCESDKIHPEKKKELGERMAEGLLGLEIHPGKYRHFKGGEYRVLFTAKDSETLEKKVVYQALYGDGEIWVRPASMWNESVTADGKRMPRFRRIEESL